MLKHVDAKVNVYNHSWSTLNRNHFKQFNVCGFNNTVESKTVLSHTCRHFYLRTKWKFKGRITCMGKLAASILLTLITDNKRCNTTNAPLRIPNGRSCQVELKLQFLNALSNTWDARVSNELF